MSDLVFPDSYPRVTHRDFDSANRRLCMEDGITHTFFYHDMSINLNDKQTVSLPRKGDVIIGFIANQTCKAYLHVYDYTRVHYGLLNGSVEKIPHHPHYLVDVRQCESVILKKDKLHPEIIILDNVGSPELNIHACFFDPPTTNPILQIKSPGGFQIAEKLPVFGNGYRDFEKSPVFRKVTGVSKSHRDLQKSPGTSEKDKKDGANLCGAKSISI